MKSGVLWDLSLRVSLLILISSTAWSLTHKHLGCWMDLESDKDISDKSPLVDTDMTLSKCVTYCSTDGFAYAGLKKGSLCSCGQRYGRHGVSNTCNYTCAGIPCGGPESNDVYYAIDTDITTRAKRDYYGYTETKSFFAARKQCVAGNGDLLVLRDPSYFNNLQKVANASGITSDLIWIGLFFNNNNKYAWGDPSIQGLSHFGTSPYWKSGETFNHNCVLLNLNGKYWVTASCAGLYPFICFQLAPTKDGEEVTQAPDDTEFVEEDTKKSFLEDNKALTFYVVLPLFVFCYGGSCVAWAIGRCWRHFKKKKRQRAREAMIAQQGEFEPDTKPLAPTDSRPLTSRDVKMEEGYTPPPPYYRVNSRASRNSKPIEEKERPIQTPVKEFRADEEDIVKRPQSRSESRRSALLGNAYNEARDRRRREGATPEPNARPRSSRSPRMSELDPPAIPPPPMQSPKPPRRAEQYKEPVASPPPVDPAEPEIDYTKLSISDIMYIRGLMSNSNMGEKKKRKKARKIIVA